MAFSLAFEEGVCALNQKAGQARVFVACSLQVGEPKDGEVAAVRTLVRGLGSWLQEISPKALEQVRARVQGE